MNNETSADRENVAQALFDNEMKRAGRIAKWDDDWPEETERGIWLQIADVAIATLYGRAAKTADEPGKKQ